MFPTAAVFPLLHPPGPNSRFPVEEHPQTIFILPQHKVPAAAHDDAVALGRHLPDSLGLCLIDSVLGCGFVPAVPLHGVEQIKQQAAGDLLFLFFHKLFRQAGSSGGSLDQVAVVVGPAQFLGQLFADFPAPAAVLPFNGDAPVVLFLLGFDFDLHRRIQFAGKKAEPPSQQPGKKAHQQRRHNGAFPHPLQAVEEYQGQHPGNHRHGGVEADFGDAKIGVPGSDNGSDEGFPRQHHHIRQHFQIDPKPQHGAADEQAHHFQQIPPGIHPTQQHHGQINKPAEQHRHRNLQPVFRLKLFLQQNQLEDHQQHIKEDGK